MSEKKPILVGSIIHLENDFQDGGYLDVRGWVTDMPAISNWQDHRIRKFVSTHARANRSAGSGSWLILSADGKKQVGEALAVGDKIHLLNMYPGAGYLDTFEWIDRLKPFKDYPMQIGVFATSSPKRDGGVSGTWTIWSASDKPREKTLVESDTIHLKNDYPNAGFLHTFGDVSRHKSFDKYDGQRLFVFTGPKPQADAAAVEGGSRTWKVTLSNLSENLVHIQNRRHNKSARWHEGGLFIIGDASEQPVIALNVTSEDEGKTLSGTMTYKGDPSRKVNFKATHRTQNIYDVYIDQHSTLRGGVEGVMPDQQPPDGQWWLGFRESQRIVAMNIPHDDEANLLDNKRNTLKGEMTYAGESSIDFKGKRGISVASDVRKSLDDILQLEWVKGRTVKMESVIVTTHKLLVDSIQNMHGTKIEPSGSFEPLDSDFQIDQLSNLQTLSHLLNSFSRYTLYELMKHSLESHRPDKDESLAPLHLFRKCFEHIATDHAIIQQATRQRRWNRSLEDNYLNAQPVQLLIMDKLAIKAVTPFQHLLFDSPDQPNDLAIVTYLSEKTHIHLVPYTKQFILIGVSYDRVTPAASIFEGKNFIGENFPAFELMAIPHEVAHYIYQHGKLEGNPISDLSEQFESNPYYRWCEELFADVYSCIVAGPLAAISMQALLMSTDRDRAWKDDEDHPTPVLRVFIFAEILRVLGEIEGRKAEAGKVEANQYLFSTVTRKLDKDWTAILKLWGYGAMDQSEGRPVRVYMHDTSNLQLDTIVNVNRVMKAIRPILVEFATRLLKEAEVGGQGEEVLPTNIPWTTYDEEGIWVYNVEMARMVNLNSASKKVQRQFSFNIKADETPFDLSNPDERLRHYLKSWSDRGPHGWGDH